MFRIWQRGHGKRAEREPITGVWERSPQRCPGAEPLVRGSGAKPPWSWNTFCFWTFNGSRKFDNFSEIWKRRKLQIFALF